MEVNSATLKLLGLQGHIYLEGGISWQPEPPEASEGGGSENSGVQSGDYHEFFEIHDIAQQPEIVESRLVFWGVPQEHSGVGTPTAFITLPSTCSEKPVTRLHVDSWEDPGHFLAYANQTPVTATGCDALAFDPSLSLMPQTSESDAPDGLTADLHVPQRTSEPSKPNSPDVQAAQVTLFEGITLNPSAANGLEACSGEQYGASSCPGGSQVGTVSVNAPGIPDGSLTGGVYVGAPEAGATPASGGEYRLFVIARAPQYGVGLRMEGRVQADEQTGRLTATFTNAPQVPFEDFTLRFNAGPRAPVANPLACGPVAPSAGIEPYGGGATRAATANGFVVTGSGPGGACPSAPPFTLTQSLASTNPQAGAFSPFTFELDRGEGQQYLSQISTTLPPGLVGAIPSVPLCAEAPASAGSCPASSQIGTVTAVAGAGAEPYAFTGRAYLTGPFGGDPYGLSVVVPALAGPYDLGQVVARAGISVGLYSGRVTVTGTVPTIVGGVPLRLRSLQVAVSRAKFASNPTSCAPLATESLLTSTLNGTDSLSSPFQVGGCGALAFAPSLDVLTGANTSKLGGASIEVKVTQPGHEANIRELQLQLPKQLVARFSTIQKACPAATFETGPPPGACAHSARVGQATVTTPVLPGQLEGTAWLVSHGAEAFPDLDLVLSGDGVRVVLVGHTHIAHSSITTSTFEALPDVPISSVDVNLPVGPDSALAANGRLCGANLLAPTTLVGQNGAKLAQNTKIAVSGCSIVLVSHRIRGRRLQLTIWVPEAGRLTLGARGISARARARKAGDVEAQRAAHGQRDGCAERRRAQAEAPCRLRARRRAQSLGGERRAALSSGRPEQPAPSRVASEKARGRPAQDDLDGRQGIAAARAAAVVEPLAVACALVALVAPSCDHGDEDPLRPGPPDELLDLNLAGVEVMLALLRAQLEPLEVAEAVVDQPRHLAREGEAALAPWVARPPTGFFSGWREFVRHAAAVGGGLDPFGIPAQRAHPFGDDFEVATEHGQPAVAWGDRLGDPLEHRQRAFLRSPQHRLRADGDRDLEGAQRVALLVQRARRGDEGLRGGAGAGLQGRRRRGWGRRGRDLGRA